MIFTSTNKGYGNTPNRLPLVDQETRWEIDPIHSKDLIVGFDAFFESPWVAEVYNIGGGRFSNCPALEAISMSERIAGRKMEWSYAEQNRIGDNGRFAAHYPNWRQEYDVPRILGEIFEANRERWKAA